MHAARLVQKNGIIQHTWRDPLRGEEAMRRREFIALIGSAATVSLRLVPVARAQQPGRIYRLGVIAGPARQVPRIVAFFDELKGLGFVEGHNLQIVAACFGLPVDQFTEAAATVAKSAPDVILCTQDPAVRAMQEATHTIPIVGLSVDMVAAGFVRSLARPLRPGARVTIWSLLQLIEKGSWFETKSARLGENR
jgi:ABC-type uncharacterized transport system substrate-binding protein